MPFILTLIVTLGSYAAFRWGFDIKLGLLPLKRDILEIWIPVVLAGLAVWAVMRRRFRALNLVASNGDHFAFFCVMTWISIFIPLVLSQTYISKVAYDLLHLESAREVSEYPLEKYFSLTSFAVSPSAGASYVTSRVTGRNSQHLTFYLYISCPFEETNSVWYGVVYKKRIGNLSSDEYKQSQYREFVDESFESFKDYSFQDAKYFVQLKPSDARDGYLRAIERIEAAGFNPIQDVDEQIILVPVFESFEERLGNTFYWIFGSIGIGAAVFFIMVLIPPVDEKGLAAVKNSRLLDGQGTRAALEFLDPRGPTGGTAILMLLNILVFVIMIIGGTSIASPTPQDLLEWGGNRRSEILDGEYWRLLTAVFLHGGLMHLAMNIIGLFLAGMLLDKVLGRVKIVVSFVVCGLIGSLTSCFWHENVVSVGASGAIYGLYGIIAVFRLFKIYPRESNYIVWFVLGAGAGMGLLFGMLGGIDNAAHIGGLIAGAFLGLVFLLLDGENLQSKARAVL